jgi:aerobic-type carbon monoxide dehydrogenase small subunit (CoxS/CutS family)
VTEVSFELNGKNVTADVEPRMTLGDCIRYKIGQTGTHIGCEHGVCGACTVILDGDAVRSCLMLAVQAEGRKVTKGFPATTNLRRCKRLSASTMPCNAASARRGF